MAAWENWPGSAGERASGSACWRPPSSPCRSASSASDPTGITNSNPRWSRSDLADELPDRPRRRRFRRSLRGCQRPDQRRSGQPGPKSARCRRSAGRGTADEADPGRRGAGWRFVRRRGDPPVGGLRRSRGVAARLGADVPFCVRGGRARVGGLGDRVVPLAQRTPFVRAPRAAPGRRHGRRLSGLGCARPTATGGTRAPEGTT